MKRRICMAFILAGVLFGAPSSILAGPVTGEEPAVSAVSIPHQIGEDRPRAKAMEPELRREATPERRRGVGAHILGRPFWGYGPNLGRRCDSCQSNCDEADRSARCRRCRVFCGR
jgi:hypothetical protein